MFCQYSYGLDDPSRYTDPTGHYSDEEIVNFLQVHSYEDVLAMFGKGGRFEGKWGFLAVLHAAQNGDYIGIHTGELAFTDGKLKTLNLYNNGSSLVSNADDKNCYVGGISPEITEAISKADGLVLHRVKEGLIGFNGNIETMVKRIDAGKFGVATFAALIDGGTLLLSRGKATISPGRDIVYGIGKSLKWINDRNTELAAAQAASKVGVMDQLTGIGSVSSDSDVYIQLGFRITAVRSAKVALLMDMNDMWAAINDASP